MEKLLWYKNEAADWNQALPLGNGRIGAMAFSGAVIDRFQINEDTLWTGAPSSCPNAHSLEDLSQMRQLVREKRYDEANDIAAKMMLNFRSQAYVPYGSIFVETLGVQDKAEDYRRELDLASAVLKTSYCLGDNKITKEAFVSLSDDVLVINIKAQKPTSFKIYQSIDLEHKASQDDSVLTAIGRCPTAVGVYDDDKESVHFSSRIAVITDGEKTADDGILVVNNATNSTILFSISTSFAGFNKMPVSEGKEYVQKSKTVLENASGYSYDDLKGRHVAEYKKYFDRVDLYIDGQNFDNVPTDERIKNAGENTVDNHLAILLFDYSRYLAISASQPSTQPMNLQGIWNDSLTPPWNSNYTMNINTEMNYWTVETCGLPELHMPYMKMIKELAEKGNTFGLRGWASWHNSDIWRYNREASSGVMYGFWQMGGFWSVRHIWEHYIHTNDTEFLKEYYPVMLGATEFLEDWMVEDEEGNLVTNPSTSPENQFVFNGKPCGVCEGSAMDMQIIFDLYDKAIKAGKILGKDISHLESIKSRLATTKIGADGRILEWGTELEEYELGHRHISHLYGIYPSDILTEQKYIDAAKKSLETRLLNGGGHTGWSNAWIAAIYARFGDGEGVGRHIKNMFSKSIYPNMLDAHPPFQIDGNFGIAAAVCEALLQSHTGEIKLIPAIPKEWKSGYVHGFVTRTGKKIDFKWLDGKAEIISLS